MNVFSNVAKGLPLNHPQQICIISKEFKKELQEELKFLGLTPLHETSALLALSKDVVEPAWAQCVWRGVKSLKIESITDAQKKLRLISDKWRYFGDQHHRRGALIAGGVNLAKKLEKTAFPPLKKQTSVPVFTLVEPNLILYSPSVQRPQEDGKIDFVENKSVPPSRAYLKLWEALTILGKHPMKGEKVVDLGASPGSWSWALAELGAEVLSLDRSKLDPKLSKYQNITFSAGDAFEFEPRKMDWVFSDVICYPQKLYTYVQKWIETGHCKKFVCTLKFAGAPDYSIIDQFRKLPHSRVVHLFHNKNEVTWISHPD